MSEPRKPRIKVEYLEKFDFKFQDMDINNEVELSLYNISTSGVGFKYVGDPSWFELDNKYKVLFGVHGETCEVEVSVTRVSDDMIGARVVTNLSGFADLLNHFYKIELLSAEMTYTGPEKMNPKKAGEPHWFHSNNGSELFYTIKEDNVTSFNITYLGNTIDSSDMMTLKFGHIWEDEKIGLKFKGSSLIKSVDSLEVDIIDEAVRFLNQVPKIDDKHKQQILDTLSMNLKLAC